VEEYQKAVEAGDEKQKGWPKDFFNVYGLSKLAINVYHSALSRSELVKKKEVQVYVCCPGYVNTDMSDHQGTLTIEEGIRTPVFLIEAPFEVKNEWQGSFFYEQKKVSTFDGDNLL
jgi:short-subunit dehydrogenase